jgi:hypothetical protein
MSGVMSVAQKVIVDCAFEWQASYSVRAARGTDL